MTLAFSNWRCCEHPCEIEKIAAPGKICEGSKRPATLRQDEFAQCGSLTLVATVTTQHKGLVPLLGALQGEGFTGELLICSILLRSD